MNRFLAFLWKNAYYLLFILLMTISILLLVQNNYYHHTIVINSTSHLTGTIHSLAGSVSDYFKLKAVNRALAEENARLLSRMPESYLYIGTKNPFPVDSGDLIRQFDYIAARVISNSVNRRNNYLVLDKGSIQGIRPGMAVIAPGGVVGQVIDVSGHFSLVMSLLNSQSKISAKLKNSNHVGSLWWDGINYRRARLIDIPSHARPVKGDTIVTSGYSQIFPEGIPVGYVHDVFIESGASFYDLEVDLAVDLNKITYVYVVKNLLRDELKSLLRGRDII